MRLNIAIFEAFTKRKLVIYCNVSIKKRTHCTKLGNLVQKSSSIPDFSESLCKTVKIAFYNSGARQGTEVEHWRDCRVAKNDTN